MKIEFTKDQMEVLFRFSRERSEEANLIRTILHSHIDELKDIRFVDAKQNVGLQTCARQEALKIVESLLMNIFPDDDLMGKTKLPSQQKAKMSPYR